MSPARALGRLRTLAALAVASVGCGVTTAGPLHATLETVAKGHDAAALADALEALIAEGKDTTRDREFAYDAAVRAPEEPTAAYAFARGAIVGRLVQARGMLGAGMVRDVERWAQKSRRLDPAFRDGAATRMLGTLYVLAPSAWLDHGDSEQGLELLEGLVKAYPKAPENALRLAEAYLALGDPAPATPHLCRCLAAKAALRRDDQSLLDHLLQDAGRPTCPSPVTSPAGPLPAK